MSFTRTKLTQGALQLNAAYLTGGGVLSVAKVSGGSGRTDPDLGQVLEAETLEFSIADAVVREGKRLTIPAFYINDNQPQSILLTEVGVYVSHEGNQILYATARADSAIEIPSTSLGRFEIRIDLVIELSNEAQVVMEIASVTYITREEARQLFALKEHEHQAKDIAESTGETVEEAQRRQDLFIEMLLNSYGGRVFVWKFNSEEIPLSNIVSGIIRENRLTTGGRA